MPGPQGEEVDAVTNFLHGGGFYVYELEKAQFCLVPSFGVRYSGEGVCARIPQDEDVTAITQLLHGEAAVWLNSTIPISYIEGLE